MLRMYHAGCAWSTTKWASKDRKPRHRGIFSTVTRLWKCGCEWLWKVSHVEYILELLGQDTSLFLAFDAEFHCTKNQHSSPLQIFCCNFFLFFFHLLQHKTVFLSELTCCFWVRSTFFSGTCQAAVLHGAAEREGSQLHLFQMPGPMGHLWPRLDFIHRDLWVFPKIVVPPKSSILKEGFP